MAKRLVLECPVSQCGTEVPHVFFAKAEVYKVMNFIRLCCALVALAFMASSGALGAPGAQAQQTHRIGQTYTYVLHGRMSQSINGHDPLGAKVRQPAAPAAIDGSENIAIKSISSATGAMTLRRTGTMVATVSGKHDKPLLHAGVTVVDLYGAVVRDNNKLGGVFLLPLPFLADRAMKSGLDLSVGDQWSGKLGVKLFGMLATPLLRYQVVGTSSLPGIKLFKISATGTAPMKEPIVSNSGYALGFASGTAWVTLQAEYDPVNRRVVSLKVDVRDTLQLFGPNSKLAGMVRDRERYDVSLDAASLMASR